MSVETTLGGADDRFRETLWTVVRQARSGEDRRGALDRLFRIYWKPVYFFIRRRWIGVEPAKDLTQGFFGSLLERDFLSAVTAEKGSFRSYLLGALGHFLSN